MGRLAPARLAGLWLGTALALLACDRSDSAESAKQPASSEQQAAERSPQPPSTEKDDEGQGAQDPDEPAQESAAESTEEPAEPPPRLYARKFVSRVWSEPSVHSEQLGYMRAGAVVTAKSAETVGNERCYRGWYEIEETGGFVCDGREVTAFEGEKLPDVQPSQPERDAVFPYTYARTIRSGTPMYKRLPTRAEYLRHERGLLPDGTPIEPPAPADAGADAGQDAGVDGGDEGEDAEDDGPPTLEELRGERGAFVRRILQKGFYVSLDRELERDGRTYWRTMSSGHVSANRLETVEPGAFEGVALAPGPHPSVVPDAPDAGADAKDEAQAEKSSAADAPPRAPQDAGQDAATDAGADAAVVPAPAHDPPLHLPIGYVLSGKTPRYRRNARGVLRPVRKKPGYHHVFEIVGEERARGRSFVRDPEGYLYDARLIRRIDPVEPPDEVHEGERWLDIDLTNQSLTAYQGETPVRATLISSGRVRGPEGSPFYHATPTGTYRVLSKHVSATMDGDHAIHGPYSLEDVPYVQFFQGALALHSAFWHNRFGRASSHGCINLAPNDALWLFEWTLPEVPAQWHGAYPQGDVEGTPIHIRGETPRG